ncbi:MAG: energy transducer TonB, partial [Thermoanaerobaculia bacterium]|nr:energy transducer TonB [Thermoanaerobaculia bacterium]
KEPTQPAARLEAGGLPRWVLPAAVGGLLLLLIVMILLMGGRSDESVSPAVETAATEATSPNPTVPDSAPAPSNNVVPPDVEDTTQTATLDPAGAITMDVPVTSSETGPVDQGISSSAGTESSNSSTAGPADQQATVESAALPKQEVLLRDGEGVENATLSSKLDPKASAPAVGPKFALFYVLVGTDGSVEKVVPLPGGATGEPQIREALELVKGAQFAPATHDGEPGRQWATVRIDF